MTKPFEDYTLPGSNRPPYTYWPTMNRTENETGDKGQPDLEERTSGLAEPGNDGQTYYGKRQEPCFVYVLVPDGSHHELDTERTLKLNPKSRWPELKKLQGKMEQTRVFPEFSYDEK